MRRLDLAQLADQLIPYILPVVRQNANAVAGGSPTVSTHALDGAIHTGTLSWAKVNKTGASLADLPTRNYADLTSRGHVLASASGLGADHTVSGLTAGHVLRAIGASAAAFAQLQHSDLGGVLPDQHHARQHSVTSASDHTVSGASWDVIALTGTNTLGVRTPLADTTAGTLEALLKSDASGGLRLQYMSTPEVRNTSGSITLNPTGTAVLPTGTIQKDLGDYNRKWRTLYAAEMYVETLVAQDVMSTIGGRVLVTPTSSLIAAIASGTGTSISMDVKHNGFAVGEWLYMAAAPGGIAQVEIFQVTAGPGAITGGYRYTVNRNQDGSGQNAWQEGDAVASLGNAVGTGYIDLSATTTTRSHIGPTVTVYARTSTGAWTGVVPTVSMGNLRSFVDYGANEYGLALGNDLTLTPTTGFSGMTADRTSGLRLFNVDFRLYSGTAAFLTMNTTTGLSIASNNAGAASIQRALTFLEGSTVIGAMYSFYTAGSAIDLSITNGIAASSRMSTLSIAALGTGNRYVDISAGSNAGVVIQTVGGTASVLVGAAGGTVALTSTALTHNGSTIWTAANDGPGTGLDADLLDGIDSSQFALLSGATFATLLVSGASSYIGVNDRDGSGDAWVLYHNVGLLRWWNATYGDRWILYPDGQMTVYGIGLFANTNGGYGLQVSGGNGILMTSTTSGYLYRTGGRLSIAVDVGNIISFADASDSSNMYAVIGGTSTLYSARLSVYGNIHSNGVVTGESYLQVAANSAPGAASGWARIALRSSDNALVAVMPSGAVRVLATN